MTRLDVDGVHAAGERVQVAAVSEGACSARSPVGSKGEVDEAPAQQIHETNSMGASRAEGARGPQAAVADGGTSAAPVEVRSGEKAGRQSAKRGGKIGKMAKKAGKGRKKRGRKARKKKSAKKGRKARQKKGKRN